MLNSYVISCLAQLPILLEQCVPTVLVGTTVPTVIVGTAVPTRVVGTAANNIFVPAIIVGTIVPTIIVGTAVPTIIVLMAYYRKSCVQVAPLVVNFGETDKLEVLGRNGPQI